MMAFNFDDFVRRFEASRVSPYPEDDPLRLVAAILEELFADAFKKAGVENVGEAYSGISSQIRTGRSEQVQEVRVLTREVHALRSEVSELRRVVLDSQRQPAPRPGPLARVTRLWS